MTKLQFGITENAIGQTTILARLDSEIVGSLELTAPRAFQNDARLVLMVEVHKNHRRQGVASAMWHFAKNQGFNPHHELEQTEDGRAWALAVGN